MNSLTQQSKAEKPESDNVFARLWALGYRRLVPIIPPDAEISPGSTLFSRIGTKSDGRGKTPGVKGNAGWYSFDWVPYEAVEEDAIRWQSMGAGVGIKTGALGDGTSLVAIDADTIDPILAKVIAEAIERRFGLLPLRFGRAPKALYPVRVRGNFRYSRIEFGPENERIEILSDGRQFVAHGIHPKTGRPYRWERELPALADLPIVDEAELLALLEDLRGLLPAASRAVIREGGGAFVDQASLRGDPVLVRRAMEALPNTTEIFRAREDCLTVGYAIKGALQDDPDLALELFQGWCERWQDPEGRVNDPEWVEGEWRRMKPPFRVGAGRLYELAERHSNGQFSRAEQWFEPVNDNDPLFPDEHVEPEPSDATIAWFDPEAWAGKPIPVREWEVRDWIPRHEVTLLYGDGGIGKTLLAHQYAVAAAAGVPWMGQETRQARVMCFFCEDSEDELQRRHADILASLGLTHADTAGRLRMSSRRNVENLLAVWDRDTGRMRHLPVWHQLRADALAFRADVVILDTIADVFAGEEQNRAQVTSFVKGVLGRLAHDIGGSVIALGHPSKSGQQSGTGTSGSTGWSNAVRSRLYLRYPDKVTNGNVRELEGMKSNYGPKGAKLKIRWNRGAFDVIASSTPSRSHEASSLPAGVRSIEALAESAVVDAIQAHPDARMSLGGKNSQFYAPTVLRKREPELFLAFSPAEVVEAVERLEAVGIIRTVEIGRSASRHPVLGLRIDMDKLSSQNACGEDVFG